MSIQPIRISTVVPYSKYCHLMRLGTVKDCNLTSGKFEHFQATRFQKPYFVLIELKTSELLMVLSLPISAL